MLRHLLWTATAFLIASLLTIGKEVHGIGRTAVWSEGEACPDLPDPSRVSDTDVINHASVQAAIEKVDALLSEAAQSLPSGLIATIVVGQETAWTQGYGYRNVSEPSQGLPRSSDLVRVASISKVYTAVLMYILRDAGVIALDDNIEEYLPSFSIKKAGWNTQETITLRKLASHTSGLPREIPYPCMQFTGPSDPSYPGCNETQVLDALSDHGAALPPNRRFHYSNLGISLLGRALGHALTDEEGEWDPLSYEEAMQTYVLRPLGMGNNTGFKYTDEARESSAQGTSTTGRIEYTPNQDTCGFSAPAGCLWASSDDMAKLMKLLFRLNEAKGDSSESMILDGSTISEMLEPSILLRDGRAAVGTPFEMEYLEEAKLWTKGKQGELPGYRSSFTVIEDLQLGVFTSALVTDVDEKSVWTIPALEILGPAVKEAIESLLPAPQLPKDYMKFVGDFGGVKVELSTHGTGTNEGYVYMTRSGDGFSLKLEEVMTLPHVMKATAINATDSCRWLDDGPDQELVEFIFDDDNDQASSLVFMGEKYDRQS